MKRLAPHIRRQRLLIEGHYAIEVKPATLRRYFGTLTRALHLRAYGKPLIYCPKGRGKAVNQGFDAFIPLIDSGISLYVWSRDKLFSVVLYSCKRFSVRLAVKTTRKFFKANKFTYAPF